MNRPLASIHRVVLFTVLLLAGCPTPERPVENSGATPSGNDTPSHVETVEQADLPPDWGKLKGRITLTGAPQPEKIVVTGNVEFCGQFDLVDESVRVNKENDGLANVMVWLYSERGEEPPAPHESYEETKDAKFDFDNRQCRFSPRAIVLRAGQSLAIKNSDTVAHNTYIEYEPHPENPSLTPGQVYPKKFPLPTRIPLIVSCSSHPWMKAYLMVVNTPYVAVTDENGEFEIDLLPPGEWQFQFYHEKFGYVSHVQGEKNKWEKGRPKLTIAGGQLIDLGEVKLDYADYE